MSILLALAPWLGGLVLLVYGLDLAKRCAWELSSPHNVVAIGLWSQNRPSAVLVGAGLSCMTYSPRAATALVARLGSDGLVSLRQALAVAAGFGLGSAVVVQLIAFDISRAAIYMMAAALVAGALFRGGRARLAARAVFGVALVFLGLYMMRSGVQALHLVKPLEGAQGFLQTLSHNRFYLFLCGVAGAALLQAPEVVLAVVFAFSLEVQGSIAVALGAAVGAAIPSVVAGLVGDVTSRRVALGMLLMNMLGASFFMAMLLRFFLFMMRTSASMGAGSDQRVIANAYVAFSLVNSAVFLLLLPAVEEIAVSVSGHADEKPREATFPLALLEGPPQALDLAAGRTAAMGRKTLDLLRRGLTAFLLGERGVDIEMKRACRTVEAWGTILDEYVRKIDDNALTTDQREMKSRLHYVARDIAGVGRIICNELTPLAADKLARRQEFSVQEAHHFESIYRLVADDFSEVLDLVESRPARPAKVLENAARIDALRREISAAHLARRTQGVSADIETSAVFIDAIAALRSIHLYVCDIVRVAEGAGADL